MHCLLKLLDDIFRNRHSHSRDVIDSMMMAMEAIKSKTKTTCVDEYKSNYSIPWSDSQKSNWNRFNKEVLRITSTSK